MSSFVPGVCADLPPSVYRTLIESAKTRNAEYSKIWDLFAFQNDFTIHLARFTQGVLRQPASISPGFRELIAAAFCMYNRYVDGLATWTPTEPAMYDQMGQRMARQGYVRPAESPAGAAK